MGSFDRIILTIYTFLLTFLSIGMILWGLRILPEEYVHSGLQFLYGNWEAAGVGILFLLISVRLLLTGSRTNKSRDTLIRHNPEGDVNITIGAIENLIAKTVRYTKGIRDVKVRIYSTEQGMTALLRLVVSPETQVPQVTEEIQKKVHDHVLYTTGIELISIKIIVENISTEFKSRNRVE